MLNVDPTTSYAVAPDGRFLMPRSTSDELRGGHLVVVLNWFETLRKANSTD